MSDDFEFLESMESLEFVNNSIDKIERRAYAKEHSKKDPENRKIKQKEWYAKKGKEYHRNYKKKPQPLKQIEMKASEAVQVSLAAAKEKCKEPNRYGYLIITDVYAEIEKAAKEGDFVANIKGQASEPTIRVLESEGYTASYARAQNVTIVRW